MNILVTGAKGFIGKNLVAELRNRNYQNIYEYDLDTKPEFLDTYCSDCDFVFHLSGVNRPEHKEEFMEGNAGFVSVLLSTLQKHQNKCPIMISSSIQAEQDNPYGRSKKAGEDLIFSYGRENSIKVYVYRFPNVFGKWCRPNYNSAVATFCHNIANDLEIKVHDRNTTLKLVYIDDVVNELIQAMEGQANKKEDGYCYVNKFYMVTLEEIADLIYSFKASRELKNIPDMSEESFSKKLYSTYLSYLPKQKFSYPLKMNVDERGSFTEVVRTAERGQFSINVSKPGITKGNHWHHTKNEKFIVVSGEGIIRFRKIDSDEIIEYRVSGKKFEVIDIPTGYTHSIVNIADTDLITLMWCNECFNPEKPDTYHLNVDMKE